MRALVMSGGGSRGAFQVGVLQRLIEEDKAWYKAFSGVSVGALNAGWLSQYVNGQLGVQGLFSLWEGLKDSDVKKKWFPFHYLHGLWKTGLYNTKPLEKLVRENLNVAQIRKSGNALRIGAVNLETLEYKLFDENSPDLCGAILGSSAFPVMFPAIKVQGHMYTDGGAREVTPLKAAIDIEGVTEIDVILASKLPGKKNRKAPKNVVDVGIAALQAALDEVTVNDVKIAQLYNQLADLGQTNKRKIPIRVFQPETALPGEPLEFDHPSIMKMIELGYKTASKQL